MANPTEAELKLLRCLWRDHRLSAREIHEASLAETGWSFSTTRKTLDRMVEKELLTVELVHGVKTFVAARSKLETMAGLIRHFTQNVLGADAPLPAAAFVGSPMIEPGEVEALEALLEELAAEEETP